jgi:hypothetical protein
VPDEDGDDDAEWRAELIKRYGSITGFLGLLAQIQLGAVDVREPVLAAVHRLPELVGRRRVLADELDRTLVSGSWRRLVLANPELPAGVADHRAYAFCVLEQLHRALRPARSMPSVLTGGATRAPGCSTASDGKRRGRAC